jgi:hypothetical protein
MKNALFIKMNCAFLYSGFSICSDKGEGTCAWTRISDDVKGGPGTKNPSRGVAELGMGPKTDPIEVALILLYPSICTLKTKTKFYRNFACRWPMGEEETECYRPIYNLIGPCIHNRSRKAWADFCFGPSVEI